MSFRRVSQVLGCGVSASLLLLFSGLLHAQQKMDRMDMDRARQMLRDARDAVKKYYYDPKYHGVDLDARYREFDERIKAATSLNDGLRMVAAFLSGLKDSHTFFDPPMRPYRLDTGFRM